jgi:hypothetical protein
MDPQQPPADARTRSFHRLARKIDKVVYRIISERRASGKDEAICCRCFWPRMMKTAAA